MAEVAVLDVRFHGRTIGTLTRLPDDRNVFVFDSGYVDNAQRSTLSLSFKDVYGALITRFDPTQTRLPPFFSNLLPEGALRDYLAERAGVKPEREFFLAWILGKDLPGAVEIVPREPDLLPPDSELNPRRRGKGRHAHDVLRFSLAGVQLKFSAVQRASGGLTIPVDGVGGSWIIKLPSPQFAGLPENEFAMMELARRVGIDVPDTKLVRIRDIEGLPERIEPLGKSAFAIKRFDRNAQGGKIHTEDFAQVFGVYPERKYQNASYRNIAQVLWVETGESGIAEFVRRFVFNALIGNSDMHLKNWSLIYPDTRTAQLSPAYDYVSTVAYIPDDKLALSFVDSKEYKRLTTAQFERFSAKAGLPYKLTQDTMRETVATFADEWHRLDLPLGGSRVREAIDQHLKRLPIWEEVIGRTRTG